MPKKKNDATTLRSRLNEHVRRWDPGWQIFVVLAILAIYAWDFHLTARGSNAYWSDILDNIAVEIVGVIVGGLALIVPFELIRGADRRRLRNLGLEAVRTALVSWCEALMGLYVAASPDKARIYHPLTFDQVFDADYFSAVGAFDLRRNSYNLALGTGAPMDHGQLLAQEARVARATLDQVVQTYAHAFDAAFYELVVRFQRSSFLRLAPHLPVMLRLAAETRSLDDGRMTGQLKETVAAVTDLITAYNELVTEDQRRIQVETLWEFVTKSPLGKNPPPTLTISTWRLRK
jgi:hypothetical protein